jgi:signal transduction histidine kinase
LAVIRGVHTSDVTSRLSLDEVSYAQAEAQLNSGNAYAAIVIPPGFTASLLHAYGLSSASGGSPARRLPTNPRAGSMGVQLATGVVQPALQQVSSEVGSKLSSEADPTLIRTVLQNLLDNAWKFTSGRDDAAIEFGMASEETSGKLLFRARQRRSPRPWRRHCAPAAQADRTPRP